MPPCRSFQPRSPLITMSSARQKLLGTAYRYAAAYHAHDGYASGSAHIQDQTAFCLACFADAPCTDVVVRDLHAQTAVAVSYLM
jgi:hypothetical protein